MSIRLVGGKHDPPICLVTSNSGAMYGSVPAARKFTAAVHRNRIPLLRHTCTFIDVHYVNRAIDLIEFVPLLKHG